LCLKMPACAKWAAQDVPTKQAWLSCCNEDIHHKGVNLGTNSDFWSDVLEDRHSEFYS
jgi:hypothetical protein